MPLKQVSDRDYVHGVDSFWIFVRSAAQIFAYYVK
jgi:hypothetical protein